MISYLDMSTYSPSFLWMMHEREVLSSYEESLSGKIIPPYIFFKYIHGVLPSSTSGELENPHHILESILRNKLF